MKIQYTQAQVDEILDGARPILQTLMNDLYKKGLDVWVTPDGDGKPHVNVHLSDNVEVAK